MKEEENMKIYNAKLVGISANEGKGITYLHFAYKSKFVDGYGVISCSLFDNASIKGGQSVRINDYYDIYVSNRNGYNNIRGMYEHRDKITDRTTIDSV